MITINFYSNIRNELNFICKLIKKIILLKNKIIIFNNNFYELKKIDKLLWIFNKQDFLPHVYLKNKLSKETPIILVNKENNILPHYNILINLSNIIPKFYINFKKIIEIISNNKLKKNLAKNRYYFYKNKGHKLNYFDIKKNI